MSRKKPRVDSTVVLFDVFYEDGGRASNRKVPNAALGGLEGDDAALTHIMDHDRKIATLSGKAPRPIKRVARSDGS